MTKIRSIIEVSQLSKVIDELEAGIDTIIGERAQNYRVANCNVFLLHGLYTRTSKY